MSLTPGTRLGPYEVTALLGAGGMGEVYRARDLTLGRDVAVKVLPAEALGDAERLERFEREARALASLNHPNVATIHGFDTSGTRHLLVMELVEGATLADRIAWGRVPLAEALAIASQVADALAAAHDKGIIHRDLKPANIKLTPDGVAKVLDFGLAKTTALAGDTERTAAATSHGTILGTTAYMSPEQARGQLVDRRTDVWAFGCVLFELLSGHSPFGGDSAFDTLAAIAHRDPRWADLPAETPTNIRQLLEHCLQKDRGRRLADIRDARLLLDAGSSRRRFGPVVAWGLAATVVIVLGGWLIGRFVPGRSATGRSTVAAIAVLPLTDLSGRTDEAYFTDGMTDELISTLAKIKSWRVISRTSVMPYKGTTKPLSAIARELGVDALVEGTVQRANDRVRISVRLVRAGPDEASLWSQEYDRDLRDVLDLQADVATAIAGQIRITVTPGEQQRLAVRHPVDAETLQLYLKGKASADVGTESAIVSGLGYLEQAIARSPAYAPAHAAMALAYTTLTPAYRAPKDVMPKAREQAMRAIELDDTTAEAHTALATVMFLFDWDWVAAEQEMQHAIELNPSSASAHELYGNYLIARNDVRAIDELTMARRLNPSALTTWASLLAAYVTLGRYDDAIAEARRALVDHPDFAFAHGWLGMALVMKGHAEEAVPILERAVALDKNVTTIHFLAMAQAAAGHPAEARRLANALADAANSRYVCAYEVGTVFLRLGDTDKAVQWLHRGLDERCDCMVWLKAEPWMNPLRTDPRYAALVRRAGFPD